MEFHMLLFSFFLNIRTIYQLIYQRLFYSKPLFYSKTSFLFLCKATFFYVFILFKFTSFTHLKFFFLFLHLFKFPIWTTIPIIKKTTKKIYFLTYSNSENKRPVEKISH